MGSNSPPPKTMLYYPCITFDSERLKTGQTNLRRPPLGLQYVMGVLRDAGYPFDFMDQVIQGKSHDDLVAEVVRSGFDIVGIHTNVMTTSGVCRAIAKVKAQTSAKVLVGGPGTIEPEPYLEAGADAAIVGEAEPRLIRVLDALLGTGTLADIPGMVFRQEDGTIRKTDPATRIQDLDNLPFPVRKPELVPLYGEPSNPIQTGVHIAIMASRGCPFRCSYCTSHQLWGHRVLLRSVKNVIAEIDAVSQQWPNAFFSFIDDVFVMDAHWVKEFCRQMVGRNINWECVLHPLSYAGKRDIIFSLMAKAGCQLVSFGAQSSSESILKSIHRNPKEPQGLARAIAVCQKHDIQTIVTYIFGLPGETEQTMKQDVDWTLKHKPTLVDFHPLYVFPESQLARDHPDGDHTSLSDKAIDRACARGFRRFYFRPPNIWRILTVILRKNPRFLRNTFYVLKMLLVQSLPRENLMPFRRAVGKTRPEVPVTVPAVENLRKGDFSR